MEKTRVTINGYGVIGRRVADAVALQDNMELIGVADVVGRLPHRDGRVARLRGLCCGSRQNRRDARGRHLRARGAGRFALLTPFRLLKSQKDTGSSRNDSKECSRWR